MPPFPLLTDAALTRRAQAGEAGALGLLLARHQAPMRAVALSLFGQGPDADDAVQDAVLTALRRIGDVRDPEAVGAWLRAIVRNNARMRLRAAARETPGLTGLDQALRVGAAAPARPEQIVERHALRDWIWQGIEQLPPQLRLVLMLRHFSGITSYQEIAEACDIPVGTVRSRLSKARSAMARTLTATAEQAYGDASAVTDESRDAAVATLEAAERGPLPREIAELWPRESELVFPRSHRRDQAVRPS
ncbi:RNA polymerase sigma factor [Streptomyces sp. NPDC090025]|uniref:RNA polymerase sigma factor n=1 Tax=Streptomyces sp. NPDC090025 TaxID=3365922 RepID=UPI003834E14A